MSGAPVSIAALQRQLAERFPTTVRVARRVFRTGIGALDDAAHGGLPIGAISEIVCTTASCGGHLLLGQLLATTRAARGRVALIDGHDNFDPGSFAGDELAHLLWVRCRDTITALAAVDLAARDPHFAIVVLDLRRATEAELRQITGPQWYRLQRAVETTDLALVVQTPRAAVPSAQLRLGLMTALPFAVLAEERAGLAARLAPALQRQRLVHSLAG